MRREVRSAAFHDAVFEPELLQHRGDFDQPGDECPEGLWWADMRTAADQILDHQGVPPDARRIFYAMVGRCIFNINDTCQHPDGPLFPDLSTRIEAILFLWGRPGTGKSTLVKMITEIYNNDPDLVGQLENRSQETFGLAKVAHSSLIVAPDVDSKFSLDPTTLASMTSGERVTMPVKFKADVCKPAFDAPIVMAGNETFAMRDQDVQGRIQRRLVPIGFQTKVDSQDRGLDDRLKADMPRIIWMASFAFRVSPPCASLTWVQSESCGSGPDQYQSRIY